MSRLMTVVWIAQFFLFLALALVLLVLPDAWNDLFHFGSLGDELMGVGMPRTTAEFINSLEHTVYKLHLYPKPNYNLLRDMQRDAQLVIGSLRLTSPLVLAFALFSSHAAMREDVFARRTLARYFAAGLAVWTYTLWRENHAPIHRQPAHTIELCVVAALALLNLMYGFSPSRRLYEKPLSGMANTRPPELWVLWLLQGLYFLLCAAAIEYYPDAVHTFLVEVTASNDPFKVIDQMEFAPPFYFALGLFSFYSMRASREWVWRLDGAIFRTMLTVWLLVFLYVWDGAVLKNFAVPMVPMVALLLANIVFGRGRPHYFSEDVGQGPDGWVFSDLFAGPILLIRSLRSRGRRATHPRGVGVCGTLEVVQPEPGQPTFPEHEFFRRGLIYPLQARFSTVTFDDDATLDARGVALRLSDNEHSPLDLLMNTGAFSGAENVVQFARVVLMKNLGKSGRKLVAKASLPAREAAIAALRRSPDSFVDQRYYSQVVRFWVGKDDVRHLVRYRLVPADPNVQETGLPTEEDTGHVRGRLEEERRPPDYLRRELKQRLEGHHIVTLLLQGQFHRPLAGDGLEWYNPGVDWHTGLYPWRDIGRIVLTESLPDDKTERLRFSPDNHPPSLGIPSSAGPRDPRSLADSERRVIRRLQGVRMWIHRTFGPPRSSARKEL